MSKLRTRSDKKSMDIRKMKSMNETIAEDLNASQKDNEILRLSLRNEKRKFRFLEKEWTEALLDLKDSRKNYQKIVIRNTNLEKSLSEQLLRHKMCFKELRIENYGRFISNSSPPKSSRDIELGKFL